MSNKRPDELPLVSSIASGDILIAEINPDSAGTRQVVKIKKFDLLSGVSGSGGDGSGIGGASNVGVGSGLISGVSDDDIKVKSLFGGTNLQITGDDQTLFLNVTGISGGDGSGVGGASNIGAGSGLISGVLDNDIKVKSLIGGTNVTLSASDNAITINSAGGGGGGGETSAFAFFSNALNNNGIIEKTFFPTVTPNIYLSGIDVDNASDLTLYLRWDGPHDGYMGTGFINGQAIPTGNIIQLGTSTRRFEGYISGLNLAGTTIVTGVANEFTGTISLQEAGAGPTPFSVFMPPVSSGTPKAGTNLGSTDYKGGDTTTGYVTFNTSDVTGIKVFDHGVSDFIDYTSYTLVDTGDARHTARIPLTINSTRNGSHTLKVIAQNNFGTDGSSAESNAVILDQTYPVISATSPSNSDYVNNQGLNSGESIDFVNSITDWDAGNGDTVLYSGLSDDILITDSGVFQNPKNVTYVTGIFNSSPNITISAARDDNGATDSENVTIQIAKNPIITGIILDSTATSATAPNIVGTTKIKGGDVVQAQVVVNTNEVTAGNIEFSVSNDGVSDGSQTAYASASSNTTLPDGTVSYTLDLNVTSSVARDGPQDVTVTARNNFETTSPPLTSAASAIVDNANFPTVTVNAPTGYGAGETAEDPHYGALSPSRTFTTFSNSIAGGGWTAGVDLVLYSGLRDDMYFGPEAKSGLYETTKEVAYNDSSSPLHYNISTPNVSVTATLVSNGMVRDDTAIVNIASTPPTFSLNGLPASMQCNTGETKNYTVTLVSDQMLYGNPQNTVPHEILPYLKADASQTSPVTIETISSGSGLTDNSWRIGVEASTSKGSFVFQYGITGASNQSVYENQLWNLGGVYAAGGSITSVTNSGYVVSGIQEGSGYISDQSTCAGLLYLGGPSINPSTIEMENVSEGGGGPNAGTVYTYQAYTNGQQLGEWCTGDHDNKFTIVTSGAVSPFLTANSTGDYLFNLDQTNRQANTSFPGALVVISQP